MKHGKRWLQILVICLLANGCVPSACIWVGDLELPATPLGTYTSLGIYYFGETVVLEAGWLDLIGFFYFLALGPPDDFSDDPSGASSRRASRAAMMNLPGRFRLQVTVIDENRVVQIRKNYFLRVLDDGTIRPIRRRNSRTVIPEGWQMAVTVRPLGRPLPAGVVFDGQFNHTPDGQEKKTAIFRR